eukprot:14473728-Ditylum_brightwellii.AAC.2
MGESLLVGEKEALVGGVEVSLGELRTGGVDTKGLHEVQRLINFGGKLVVARALQCVLNIVKIPIMQAADIGVSAMSKDTENSG